MAIQFIAPITEKDMDDILWSALGSKVLSAASEAECDLDSYFDEDLVPYITVDTKRNDISVSVETREIMRGDDLAAGWEFIPTIVTDAVNSEFTFDTEDDLLDKFRIWNNVIELCKYIYQTELFPNQYLED